jgi:hypothetical protein
VFIYTIHLVPVNMYFLVLPIVSVVASAERRDTPRAVRVAKSARA